VAEQARTEQEVGRRSEFRRMVAISVVLHLCGLGLAVARPAPRLVAPPQVISVELVADPEKPRSQARPAPAPKPRRPKKTVLPAKPREPKKKREAAKQPPRRKEVFLDPAPKEEKSLDDLLSEFREERGESTSTPAPEPVRTAAATPTPGATSGAATGVRISPELADWMRRAKLHVKRSWVVQPGFRMQALTTHVTVRLDAQGNVVGEPTITRRSGNPWYDESVVRGIEKASPLPAPPKADDWPFIFTPEDSF